MFRPPPALPAKSVPLPSSSDLCVSAFSSPNVDARDAASSVSPLSATLTKNTRGCVSDPIVNPNLQFNRRLISNSHGITSFAYAHPLTPIESYSCKKQGGGGPFQSPPLLSPTTPADAQRHPQPLSVHGLTSRFSGYPGGGSLLTTHYPLLTLRSLKPPLRMAHPYLCTCKKGPAARETRYPPCAVS